MISKIKSKSYALSLLSLSFLVGCSTLSPSPDSSGTLEKPSGSSIDTFYDYQLFSLSNHKIDIETFVQQTNKVDVILVGEWHTHAGVHLFQTQLLKALIPQSRGVALSMEQFSRDKQNVVDDYLNNEIGEQTLITDGNAWPNYESDYRPLVELAKSNQIDIIAANAPKTTVKCIAKQGLTYLDNLSQDQRRYVATSINTKDSPYKDKFMASMHHGTSAQNERQYAAQATWDETMAESIVLYLQQYPNKQIMHIAGKFHTEEGLGTAAAILRRNPHLSIAIITPTEKIMPNSTDYQLLVGAPPVRYIKPENRMKAYKQLSTRSQTTDCK
ncbi:ChaN family lipoprotein [Vibrio rumoiensis]|uniref:Haem-binding uptake Tiki superfamily ChaN domain-containing protein n=1 Tax=Vibrio rumoiensis 1S-45 TaxID=1188252 RepID=A0A1E5E1J9_9VIBR|nr:ChaN family lipoprotein [Vibrio rumoiensis]OEF25152.1 hypothetical protein A1QC_09615 [Vibrio rumoiensis 1S-45]